MVPKLVIVLPVMVADEFWSTPNKGPTWTTPMLTSVIVLPVTARLSFPPAGLVAVTTVVTAVALWVAPQLQSQLFQQEPRDLAVFGAVGLTLLLAGVSATLMPALRASRVAPNEVLRDD